MNGQHWTWLLPLAAVLLRRPGRASPALGYPVDTIAPRPDETLPANSVRLRRGDSVRATVTLEHSGPRVDYRLMGHVIAPSTAPRPRLIHGHFFYGRRDVYEGTMSAGVRRRGVVMYTNPIAPRSAFEGSPQYLDVLWTLENRTTGEARHYLTPRAIYPPD